MLNALHGYSFTTNNKDVGGSLYEIDGAGIGYIESMEDIKEIAVGSSRSNPIKLSDVATVQKSSDLRLGIIQEDGEELPELKKNMFQKNIESENYVTYFKIV